MKWISGVLACFVLATGVAHGAEKQAPTFPFQVVEALQPSVPEGWTMRSDSRSIVITRDEPVTLLSTISLPAMPREDLLREFGRKSDYLIVLVFRERLSEQDYAELKAKRDRALKLIEDNPYVNSKARYGMVNTEKERHPLPTYSTSRFSIYLHRTDIWGEKVLPESAAAERDKLFDALSHMLQRYEQADD